eukprot:TRINITY_DN1137_c0_g1_i4.p1 TRINITY_DN1137_c0_g1~~TRINITY_DN1137_c0_g1_i4.p1  ORF type:complete len:336 (-),score=103.11 TRINITY_DN1137_c0_g1_i4:65-1072(-)
MASSGGITLQSDTLIFANSYWLKLRLPHRVAAECSTCGVLGAVDSAFGFVCRTATPGGGGAPARCKTCGAGPVAVRAVAEPAAEPDTFLFTVTPRCTSTRAHFGCDLVLALPEVPGCAQGTALGELVSQPFRILSRNCKYLPKHRGKHAGGTAVEQHQQQQRRKRRERRATSEASFATTSTTTSITATTHFTWNAEAQAQQYPHRAAQWVPGVPRYTFEDPVLVDENAAVAALGSASQTSLMLTFLTTAAARLKHTPLITVCFFEAQGCWAQFTSDFQIFTRNLPTIAAVDHKRITTIVPIEMDETPTLVRQFLWLSRCPYILDGRLRYLACVVR